MVRADRGPEWYGRTEVLIGTADRGPDRNGEQRARMVPSGQRSRSVFFILMRAVFVRLTEPPPTAGMRSVLTERPLSDGNGMAGRRCGRRSIVAIAEAQGSSERCGAGPLPGRKVYHNLYMLMPHRRLGNNLEGRQPCSAGGTFRRRRFSHCRTGRGPVSDRMYAVKPGGGSGAEPGGPAAAKPGGPAAAKPGGPAAAKPGGPEVLTSCCPYVLKPCSWKAS